MRISDWSSDGCSSDLVLDALARKGADQSALVCEVVASVMKLHAVAMPRQRDIGGVAIQSRRREHMGTVRRHTLCLMDCGGITVIDGGIVLRIERDGSAVVQCYGHSCRRDEIGRAHV